MKKSVEILGLPVISITEGRELGMSKTLLIDAKNGNVAAITIEDEDWYRGVKLIPYESVIAIGDDAVTVTNSENILKLEEASDYENLLDENIRVIGTKAITKTGTIQGKITEVFVGDNGRIEKCEITSPDGTTTEVAADQISIFGKQVTVIDPEGEKKNNLISHMVTQPAASAPAAPEAKPQQTAAPVMPEMPKEEPVKVEEPQPEPAKAEEEKSEPVTVPEPEPVSGPEPAVSEPEKEEEAEKELPKEPEAEEVKEESGPMAEAEAVKDEPKTEEPKEEAKEETPDAGSVSEPVETKPSADAAVPEVPKAVPAPKPAVKPIPAKRPEVQKQQAADKATEERHRRFLLGKKAARTIKTDNGIVIVEAGADITEEVLQKAKLSNKFIELSMNVQ